MAHSSKSKAELIAELDGLRKSHQIYQSIIDTAQEGIWVMDGEGRTVFANENLATLLGCSLEEMSASSIFDFVDTAGRKDARRFLARRRKQVVEHLEFRFLRRDGTEAWVTMATSPMVGNEGESAGSLAMVSDITERRQSEEALRSNQRLLNAVFDAIPQSLWVKDRAGRYLHVNSALAASHGVSAEDLIGRHTADVPLGNEAQRAAFIKDDARVFLTGERLDVPRQDISLSSGGERVRKVIKVPISNEQGEVVALVGVSEDITERLASDQALRNSEQRLAGILDLAGDAIVSMNAEHRISLFNRGAEKIFGFSADEVIGQPATTLLPKEWQHRYVRLLERFTASANDATVIPEHFDFVGQRKCGEVFPVEGSISKLTLDTGQVLTVILRDISERRAAEDKLRASEQLFQTVFNSIPIRLSIKDREGRYVLVNEELARVSELGAEGFVGKWPHEVHHHVKLEARSSSDEDQEVLRTGKTVNVPERHFISPTSTDMWHRIIKVPLRDEKGEITGMLGIREDITERKSAETQLIESEERYRSLVEGSVQGVMVQRDGRPLFVNDTFAVMFGYTTAEIMAMDDLGMLVPPHYRELMRAYGDARRKGREAPESYVSQGVRKDGGLIWLETAVRLVNWPGGTAIQSTIFDVTERLRAENELRESEEKYRGLVETSHDLIWRSDADGRFTYLNPAWAGLLEYPLEAMLGRQAQEFKDEFVVRSSQEFRAMLMDGQTVTNREEVFQTKSGRAVTLSVNALPIFDEVGDYAGSQGTAHDVTEHKRLLSELSESRRLLQTVLDSVPTWIFLKNREGKLQMVNRSIADFYRRSPEELIGMRFADLAMPGDDVAISEETDALVFLKGEQVGPREVIVRDREGTLIYRHSVKVPLKDDAGNVTGIVTATQDVTALKLAERELEENRRLLQTVLDSVPTWIFVKDRDGVFQMVNRSIARFYNHPPEAFIGKRFRDFTRTESEARISEMSDRQLIESGETLGPRELVLTGADGSLMYRESAKVPLKDDNGNVVGIVGASEDITLRKIAERELVESRRLLRTLLDTVPMWLWVQDQEGRFLMVNRAMAEFYNQSPEQLVGKTFREVALREREAKLSLRTDRSVVARNRVVELPRFRILAPDGSVRIHQSVKLPLQNEAEEVVGIVGASLDITERRQAEEQLRVSEERFRATVDHTPSQVVLKDLNGRYIFANRKVAEIRGIEPLDMIGMHTRDLFTDDLGETIVEMDRQVADTGKVVERELNMPIADGSLRTSLVTKFPVYDSRGRVVAIGTINTDIHDKKILESQLRQSQKMQALGTLAGGVAHDFNNILQPIIGYTELLLEKSDPAGETHGYLSRVARSAHRARELISQILLFSRRGQATKRTTDLSSVTQEVSALLHSTFSKGITLTVDIDPVSSSVLCDPSQIYQALLNLCVNAGQAVGEVGKVTIMLKQVVLDGLECFAGVTLSGNYVRLSVTDNGVGMNEETLSHIFDPFFTTKDVGQGTGLGLSTVFGIVQEHEGGVAVRSSLGEGTTVDLYVPAVNHEAAAIPVQVAGVSRGHESILFVDDEEAIKELGRITLERFGYRVTALTDGLQALQTFADHVARFDLVVTDQNMPSITGSSLATRMRALRPDIPIILCTGHGAALSPDISTAAGFNACIYKPVPPAELGRVVRDVLDAAAK